MPAPMVKLLDHLECRGPCPASAMLPTVTTACARPPITGTCTSRRSWSAAALPGCARPSRPSGGATGSLLVDERHWLGGTATPRRHDRRHPGPRMDRRRCGANSAPRPGRRGPHRGDRARGLRRRVRGGVRTLRDRWPSLWHVRAGAGRARDGCPRTPDRVRGLRPARRDAGLGRRGSTRSASACGRASAPWSSPRTTPDTSAAAALAAAGVRSPPIVDVGTGRPRHAMRSRAPAWTSAPGGR